MFSSSHAVPCPCFPVAVLFPDVEPDVLEREAAHEVSRAQRPGARKWHTYLHRALPALEHNASDEMAQALLSVGNGVQASVEHAERMRRQAISAGAANRARFWADVADEIGRAGRA